MRWGVAKLYKYLVNVSVIPDLIRIHEHRDGHIRLEVFMDAEASSA